MATARYTVIYEAGTKQHKLTKLLVIDDGSYAVTCPYHPSEKVSLAKLVVNYADPASRRDEEPLEVALVDDDQHRLKLIHHPDGFVQFSGRGIKSGRNHDGSPRGLGLISFKLNRPTAGPALGITIQNPRAFQLAESTRSTDLIFRAEELAATPADNGLAIELYYFAGLWRRFVRIRDGQPIIWIRHPSGAVIEARVCWPSEQRWEVGFVAVDVYAAPIRFGDAESGFAFSGPTRLIGHNKKGELEAEALVAVYPPAAADAPAHAMPLMFPTRDDAAYTEGGESPSAGP